VLSAVMWPLAEMCDSERELLQSRCAVKPTMTKGEFTWIKFHRRIRRLLAVQFCGRFTDVFIVEGKYTEIF
jgi:hypothetical protein